MIYTNIKALAEAVFTMDLTDKAQTDLYAKLVSVYFDALHNPPEGVIGVGAITYAEQALVNAQIKT